MYPKTAIFVIIMMIINILVINIFLHREKEIIRTQKAKMEALSARLEKKLNKLTVYKVNVTFYSLTKKECDNNPFVNALGLKPIVGRDIAVSRDLIHLLGKYVYIEGYGVRYVTDLMNKRYKKSVDILVPNSKLALKLGRKENVKLVVIGNRLSKK